MAAWRYEFYFLVAKTIFYSLAALVRKILFCHSKVKFISSRHCVISSIYLTDFLKTNLTKFSVVWVKKRQKASILSPRSSKIIVTKKKERRKRKSEEKERRRRKKKAMVALLVFIIVTFSEKGPFADNVIKNAARCILYFW